MILRFIEPSHNNELVPPAHLADDGSLDVGGRFLHLQCCEIGAVGWQDASWWCEFALCLDSCEVLWPDVGEQLQLDLE
jgi:hypothetical protein